MGVRLRTCFRKAWFRKMALGERRPHLGWSHDADSTLGAKSWASEPSLGTPRLRAQNNAHLRRCCARDGGGTQGFVLTTILIWIWDGAALEAVAAIASVRVRLTTPALLAHYTAPLAVAPTRPTVAARARPG